MSQIQMQIVRHQDKRVLTTAQVAEAFGTDNRRISENYARNINRYVAGKHYFALDGEEKRAFLDHTQIAYGSKNAGILYLWTERGVWMHAKSLNNDIAWSAYEKLVDEYFERSEKDVLKFSNFSPVLQMLIQTEQRQNALEARQLKQEEQVEAIKETFLDRDENWRSKMNGLLTGAARKRGGDYQDLRNESYKRLEERGRCDLTRRLNNMKDRAFEGGASKTAIDKMNRMDVIEADPKLKEIYGTIVKELSLSRI